MRADRRSGRAFDTRMSTASPRTAICTAARWSAPCFTAFAKPCSNHPPSSNSASTGRRHTPARSGPLGTPETCDAPSPANSGHEKAPAKHPFHQGFHQSG
jgi:hypothetical protein